MTYDPERDGPLVSGADPYGGDEDLELLLGHGETGITPAYSAGLAEEILAETSTPLPNTTPRRSGIPRGYGKYGGEA